MSAIKLYTSKTDAFYFKDSQRNRFYEFGGIQLLPYNYYLQPYTYSNTITKVESFRLRDDILLNDLSLYIQATVGYGIKFSRNTVMPYDYGNELIYLRFTHSGGYFYSNPFYYTALDEDKTSLIGYRDNFVDDLYYVSLKVWFRQKSRQSELNSYYETKTRNTVTQAIKTHDLEMYESEFMSMDDLIMTTEILESPCLYIDDKICSLFEAVKLPELTQQENFGKIKFILSSNDYTKPIVTEGLVLNLDAGNPLSYPGTGTTWTDLTTNGNNGTLINGPTFDSANGGSIVFDGVDDYVSSFPTQISDNGSKTISCFFKINNTLRSGLCGTRNLDTGLNGWVLCVNRTTSGNLTYYHTSGSILQIAAGISTNTWYNACVTYDVSTAIATLYLNGIIIGSPATSFTTINSSSFNGVIGAETVNGGFLNGNIAQTLIYNRALTPTEILANFNATKGRYGL